MNLRNLEVGVLLKRYMFGLLLTLLPTLFVIGQTNQITYYFAGELNDSFGSLSAGTPFCGSFTYDGSQTENLFPDPNAPYYGSFAYTEIELTMDGTTVSKAGYPGGLTVYDHGEGYPDIHGTGHTTG